MFWFGFVILTSDAISCKSTNPIKHPMPIIESFSIGVGFSSSYMSTHFFVMSEAKASEKKRKQYHRRFVISEFFHHFLVDDVLGKSHYKCRMDCLRVEFCKTLGYHFRQ